MLRLTGGYLKGQKIETPKTSLKGEFLRPTRAKIREAYFHSLRDWLPEAWFLDLFAGSGLMSWEALSRGAQRAVLIDSSIESRRLIRKNQLNLGLKAQSSVLQKPLTEAMPRVQSAEKPGPFDLIYADPPYHSNWKNWLLQNLPWAFLLKPEGRLTIEGSKREKEEEKSECFRLVKVREKTYGETVLSTYQLR